jgi:hypothetical protein
MERLKSHPALFPAAQAWFETAVQDVITTAAGAGAAGAGAQSAGTEVKTLTPAGVAVPDALRSGLVSLLARLDRPILSENDVHLFYLDTNRCINWQNEMKRLTLLVVQTQFLNVVMAQCAGGGVRMTAEEALLVKAEHEHALAHPQAFVNISFLTARLVDALETVLEKHGKPIIDYEPLPPAIAQHMLAAGPDSGAAAAGGGGGGEAGPGSPTTPRAANSGIPRRLAKGQRDMLHSMIEKTCSGTDPLFTKFYKGVVDTVRETLVDMPRLNAELKQQMVAEARTGRSMNPASAASAPAAGATAAAAAAAAAAVDDDNTDFLPVEMLRKRGLMIVAKDIAKLLRGMDKACSLHEAVHGYAYTAFKSALK